MILAAGRGKRLRPLTDSVPKPLLKVKGQSLIEYHIAALVDAGIHQLVINHAWLGEQIVNQLGNGEALGADIQYSAEAEPGLETAGGILQALPKLTDGESPFIVVNGDVLTDFDFKQLKSVSLEEGCLAHLVLVPTPSYKAQGDFGLQAGKVMPHGELTFSGISVLHPDLFKGLLPGASPLAPLLRAAMKKGQVSGVCFDGAWDDIGTPERLALANASMAQSCANLKKESKL